MAAAAPAGGAAAPGAAAAAPAPAAAPGAAAAAPAAAPAVPAGGAGAAAAAAAPAAAAVPDADDTVWSILSTLFRDTLTDIRTFFTGPRPQTIDINSMSFQDIFSTFKREDVVYKISAIIQIASNLERSRPDIIPLLSSAKESSLLKHKLTISVLESINNYYTVHSLIGSLGTRVPMIVFNALERYAHSLFYHMLSREIAAIQNDKLKIALATKITEMSDKEAKRALLKAVGTPSGLVTSDDIILPDPYATKAVNDAIKIVMVAHSEIASMYFFGINPSQNVTARSWIPIGDLNTLRTTDNDVVYNDALTRILATLTANSPLTIDPRIDIEQAVRKIHDISRLATPEDRRDAARKDAARKDELQDFKKALEPITTPSIFSRIVNAGKFIKKSIQEYRKKSSRVASAAAAAGAARDPDIGPGVQAVAEVAQAAAAEAAGAGIAINAPIEGPLITEAEEAAAVLAALSAHESGAAGTASGGGGIAGLPGPGMEPLTVGGTFAVPGAAAGAASGGGGGGGYTNTGAGPVAGGGGLFMGSAAAAASQEVSSGLGGGGAGGLGLEKYKKTLPTTSALTGLPRLEALALRTSRESKERAYRLKRLAAAAAAAAAANANAAAGAASASGSGSGSGSGGGSGMTLEQGGGARRTRRRRQRHHKTRRQHRSHKAKTHHRSRASRRRHH